MARNQVAVHVTKDAWVELTGGAATKISWSIVTTEEKTNGVYLRVTTNGTAPTQDYGLRFAPNETPELNRTILDYQAGVAGATRVWVKAVKDSVLVVVSDDSV
jgi:hypothetical protein